ncbi:bifunctional proline dehydrogenase/L-glutamate gamma-semialdehyde dehydrogenase PutA [Pelomicrobium methylotrophicum]|uniref:Bifunctional protein PutA n=1 Tax=Pelomicrobium methylotrophicum TaxID=2602750 RepID=A0A5C7EWX5_9PROT|nr:bifunctional proline dehydrogenase/L-glutamate gamma-semialdehyde dehydrogenase PutA [Pelomicrobium methylotrophicum]TXF12840.1 bifunctional proline dehydrogenase/L-glutamate gamma-semialdehyde dehydrogenase PutA [Pelomicrobium methylotrophicum]
MDVQPDPAPDDPSLRGRIRAAFLADERETVERLARRARLEAAAQSRVRAAAEALVKGVRARQAASPLEAFLREYDLSSQEGVVLMCLAEALLRIPDAATADSLIRDKLPRGDWEKHLGRSPSFFVNASTFGLLLTGRVVALEQAPGDTLTLALKRLAARGGEPVVRAVLRSAMGILARQFVMGETIEEALKARDASPLTRYSFDMLGEAALTARDAERYYQAYAKAIDALAGQADDPDPYAAPGISIKLSALHPRYEHAQRQRVMDELVPRLSALVRRARDARLVVTLDAEESERLELMLDVFAAVFTSGDCEGWEGFGLAVQAYQKRASAVIEWLAALARARRRRIPLRLVKGAYWDTEVKRAQVQGLAGYPVFTRKRHTDVSYCACARAMLEAQDAFFCQFATHNAQTIAYVLECAGAERRFEFQRLYGMGEALYREVHATAPVPCRIYAPVGSFDALLPYLVRRLLENGANTSFVNRVGHPEVPVERLTEDPVATVEREGAAPHPRVPLPVELFGSGRKNSLGFSFADPVALDAMARGLQQALSRPWRAAPLVAGRRLPGAAVPVRDPADRRRQVGEVVEATPAQGAEAIERARAAASNWDRMPTEQRARILERVADLLEAHRDELMARIVREAGRTLPDALAEVREAADFCRYYAAEARRLFTDVMLPGPTGEENRLRLRGRGVFVCVSPWNFPLAIFVGQIAAALAAGNSVVAKPAPQTPLTAMRAVELMLEAGVPEEVLHFVPGGRALGAALTAHPGIAGVAFTGSFETARAIAAVLAQREGPIVPLIAETGGVNAMVVDSSALTEQVVVDTIQSAFNSAGQRCSALRLLLLQEEVAERTLEMLSGAVDELKVGDPLRLDTDVGPLIDEGARERLQAHGARMSREARLVCQAKLPQDADHGCFFAPQVFEIGDPAILRQEVFGPILHVARWKAGDLERVVEAINATGYGLTLGVHSRLESTVERLLQRARVGNVYVNRNMIGAVVGCQPFGGEGLSGTGPKAGGPHTLPRYAVERSVCVNTAAAGGNAALLASLGD